MLKKAVPKKGPNNHPTAPTPIKLPPMTNMGSRPVICAPMFSISNSAKAGTATATLAAPLRAEEPRLMKRRERRSLRNSSHESCGVCDCVGVDEVEAADDAWRERTRAEDKACGRCAAWKTDVWIGRVRGAEALRMLSGDCIFVAAIVVYVYGRKRTDGKLGAQELPTSSVMDCGEGRRNSWRRLARHRTGKRKLRRLERARPTDSFDSCHPSINSQQPVASLCCFSRRRRSIRAPSQDHPPYPSQ